MPVRTFAYRALGAARLDPAMYEGIENDPGATRQAAALVLLSSLAAGIGASGWHGPSLVAAAITSLIALATWTSWAVLTFHIGSRFLPEPTTNATLGEVMRTTGFAAAPGLVQVFGAFPDMMIPVFVGSWIWMLAAMVVAVQHALDYRRVTRAVGVCVVAAAVTLAVTFGIALALTRTLHSAL